jgi:hypothetical protein
MGIETGNGETATATVVGARWGRFVRWIGCGPW